MSLHQVNSKNTSCDSVYSLWELACVGEYIVAGDRYAKKPETASLWVSKANQLATETPTRIPLAYEAVTSVVQWPFRQDCVLVTVWNSVLLVSLADAEVIAKVSVPNVGRAAVSPSGHVALAVNGPPNFPYARVFLYAADRHRAADHASRSPDGLLAGFEGPPTYTLGRLGPACESSPLNAQTWITWQSSRAHYGRLHAVEWVNDTAVCTAGWDAALRLWHLPPNWMGGNQTTETRAAVLGALLFNSSYSSHVCHWLSDDCTWSKRRDEIDSVRPGHFGRVERLALRPLEEVWSDSSSTRMSSCDTCSSCYRPEKQSTTAHVASVGYDGRVLVWAAEDGRMAAQALVAPPPDMEVLRRDCLLRGEDPPRPPPMLCGLSWLDPNHLAVSSFDGELTVLRFDEAAGRLTTVAETRLVTREPIYAVAALGDGRFASAGPAVQIWELGPERGLRREQPHPERFFISASLRDSASDIPSAGSARSEPSYSASYY